MSIFFILVPYENFRKDTIIQIAMQIKNVCLFTYFDLILHQILYAMNTDTKKRHIVSLEKLPQAALLLFNEKYPKGYADYLDDIEQFPKPDGSQIHAVNFETETDVYLVKVTPVVDNPDDLKRWLDNEGDEEGGDEGATLPDDNVAQYEDESQE